MSTPSANSDAHMPQLDGLRAIAATLVVVQHYSALVNPILFSTGRIGVWLFFVLSGFLITGILVRSRDLIEISPGERRRVWLAFYMRRILRIWPLYYALLLIAVILDLPEARRLLPWYLVHLANFGVASTGYWVPTIGHYWTLGIEEQFYLVWPLIVLVAPRRFAIPVAAIAVLFAPIFRLLMMTVGHQNDAIALLMTPSGFDGLGMGALLALFRRGDALTCRRFINAGLVLGIVLLAGVLAARVTGKGFRVPVTTELFGFALVSTWLVGRGADGFGGIVGRVLTLAPLVYLGRISYGLYMFNLPLPDLLGVLERKTGITLPIPTEPGIGRFLVCYVITAGIATVSWYLLERPINDLKRFFPYPSRPKPLAKPASNDLDLTTSTS